MTTLTKTPLADLPRVNLLPPEIEEAARLRRLQVLLALLLLGLLGLVAMAFVWAGSQVSAAEGDLQDAQAEGATLQAEVDTYAEVPLVQGQVAATQSALVTAMTPEIRFSFLMNDMSLAIPSSSRLSNWTAINTDAAEQIGAVTGSAATAPTSDPALAAAEAESMGTVTFEGKSNSLDGVASWLQSLAAQDSYIAPSLASAVKDDNDTTGTVYTVSSSALLSLDAASDRYQQVLEGE